MIDLTLLLTWILVAYGITNIVVTSKIFKPFREWVIPRSIFFGGMLQCMMCFSFWVGLLLSETLWSPTNLMQIQSSFRFTSLLYDGFLASGSTWLIYCWTVPKLSGVKV